MDTVSMLNKMSFYCQPILPLVYDESMSYYETLCKVVGQLNTTGDTVNKLNEGLTGEIADRQAADAALDERLKLIEATNAKIHFLIFDGANPNGGFPTRRELYQWVHEGDAIFTLFRTYEEGRGQIYAASCAYNAGNWGSEASNDFSIIVPLETSYDAAQDYAVRQKVAKLSIPLSPQTNLNVAWRLKIIEINTPYTSADGVVNLVATVSGPDSVNCSITPSEFLSLYNMTRGSKNLCVAVNARLEYDAHVYSSSIATVNPDGRTILIAFEKDNGVYTDYGVNQTIRVIHYLIGNAETNTWEHESIRSRIQDFVRYEGFQFTRKSGNVIATENDSTPSAVYSYYKQLNGKFYQNLPACLIDEVDNAEYWNGTFDSYSDGHITFTFTTANYADIGEKMTVRIIELSATRTSEAWSYASKEFDIPYRPTSFLLDVWLANETPTIDYGDMLYEGDSSLDFDDILELVDGHQDIIATLHEGTSETSPEWSSLVYSMKDVNNGVGSIMFSATMPITLHNGIPFMDCIVVFSKDESGTKKVEIIISSSLPVPSPDGSDNGKVPIINGAHWELKTPDSGTVDTAMSDTSTNAVQNKVIKKYVDDHSSANAVLYTTQELTYNQKFQARKNIEAAGRVMPTITGGVSLCPSNVTDSNTAVHTTTTTASGDDFTLTLDGGPENVPVRVKGIRTPTGTENDAAANVEYVKNSISAALNNLNGNEVSY